MSNPSNPNPAELSAKASDTAASVLSDSVTGGRRARIALIAMLMLAAVGFGIALELTDVYYMTHTDSDYVSMCAISEGANCQTVALSDYSTLLGAPVSVWAMAGYLFFAFLVALALFHLNTGYGLGLVGAMGLLFLGVSIWLVVLMSFIIHSICVLCVAIDFVNVFLLTLAILAARSVARPFFKAIWDDITITLRKPLRLMLIALVGFGVLGGAWAFGSYLVRLAEAGEPPALQQAGPQCEGNATGNPVGNSIQMGVNDQGHAWVGAANPVLVVEEFTDYQCPHCRKAHRAIRQQLSKYPDKLRVYHRHFPLDQACNSMVTRPFHKVACEMSRMAICAQQQGRFWEMNDYLFENSNTLVKGDATFADVAARLELDVEKFTCCMNDSATSQVILKDVEDGIAAGVKGTPSFRIDGKLHVGSIPKEVWKILEK